jgi:hypothetical protein
VDKTSILLPTFGGYISTEPKRATLMCFSVEISGLKVANDAFKTTLNLMANACDGVPFPLKAVPQTVLLVIKHIEVSFEVNIVLNLTEYLVERTKRGIADERSHRGDQFGLRSGNHLLPAPVR